MKKQSSPPTPTSESTPAGLGKTLSSDLLSGAVVFLVALPLCLGIALASGAPLISGIISGIVGGIVVGSLSGSHTSVSGPAAGLVAVVLAQIATLGSFEAFLLAVMIAGVLQLGLGLAKTGALASFVPNSVIKGLLAAIGVILILKQIPHVLGHDTDPEGEMAFEQPDHENTFSELLAIAGDLHVGAAVIGVLSLALLLLWTRIEAVKRFPAPLAVVIFGVGMTFAFDALGGPWAVSASHMVRVPEVEGVSGFVGLLTWPDFTQWSNPAIYVAAVTIAVVASLETLLNLEAVDRLDVEQRSSPPNRELLAQGAGNIVAGLVGGLPITSVVIRGSVNVQSGAKTKLSAIIHGVLLVVTVVGLPWALNRIPLACLAAILLLTGYRLASPAIIRKMWAAGRDQFIPFAVTVVAIVFTDLLVGLCIGMGVSLLFILSRQLRRPVRQISEKHLSGEVLHIELAEQVSFLNQTSLERVLEELPRGRHVLLDAQASVYIDPDVLALIRDYRDVVAPARGVKLSMIGFRDAYELEDKILFVDYSTRELQDQVSPDQVLEILRQGNQRFAEGRRLNRDLARQVGATAQGQHPLAVVLSCIDSRTPAELLFDVGLGDVFSVRVAGNVLSPKVLGSMEYGCEVAGSRLIAVVGHTRCGAVTAAVKQAVSPPPADEPPRCQHLHTILEDIEASVGEDVVREFEAASSERQDEMINDVARANVLATVRGVVSSSETIAKLVAEQRIAIVGVLYDVSTGTMEFMVDDAIGLAAHTDEGFQLARAE
ncbi:SulP family inorganic anion transporter [Enhygromyxa salina]|uniref:C4-dicarboxylic acid transporter DauA n=1 Tax=Enhygromyxa salina TaxID=215803 RepID=A0A2S9XU40_9BACT|nr:SulP family inorganic anion transporter [Enhygromyxa salina]PRP96250.1 C4-dicarboxylic acid transporter DauA [Enhygromyxa salina]